MKRFCVLTTGRTGSTSLLDALSCYEDIAVPDKQINCPDNELFHPERVRQHAVEYSKLTGMESRNEQLLLDAFFHSNKQAAFAGFKTMPNRHQDTQAFFRDNNIQVITLLRDDIASTVASFIVAADFNTWRRNGGEQKFNATFIPEHEQRVISHLTYILSSMELFKTYSNVIHLTYEELCKDDFCSRELDDFFQHQIKLQQPKQPISGESYINNWDEFTRFVEDQSIWIKDQFKGVYS